MPCGALLELVAEQLGEADAVVGVLAERDHALGAQRLHGVGHGDGDPAVVVAGIEHLRIALVADRIGPAVRVDVGHLVAMRDLDRGQHVRALVLADHGHDLVAGDQLLDRRAGLFRNALGVLDDQLDRPAEDAAGVVDDLGGDFDAVLDLRALRHRAGRRLRHGDADLDRIGRECRRCQQAGGECRKRNALHCHWGPLLITRCLSQLGIEDRTLDQPSASVERDLDRQAGRMSSARRRPAAGQRGAAEPCRSARRRS